LITVAQPRGRGEEEPVKIEHRVAVNSMKEFKLEGKEYIELNDLLKVTGLFDSGGMAKTAISEGLVTVDGHPELRRRCKIRTGQVVGYEGRTIVVL
jgi:ribosome-associated protein